MRLASVFCALLALGGCQQPAGPVSDARIAELIQKDFVQFCEAGAAAGGSGQIVAALEAAGWYEWFKDEAGQRTFSKERQRTDEINFVSLERRDEIAECRVSNPRGGEAVTAMLTDWLAARPGARRRTEASQIARLLEECEAFDIEGNEYAACSFTYNEGTSPQLAVIIPAGSIALEPPGQPRTSPQEE